MCAGLDPVDVLLLMACSENDLPKVEELLAAGANMNIADNTGKSPLDLASKPEVKEVLEVSVTRASPPSQQAGFKHDSERNMAAWWQCSHGRRSSSASCLLGARSCIITMPCMITMLHASLCNNMAAMPWAAGKQLHLLQAQPLCSAVRGSAVGVPHQPQSMFCFMAAGCCKEGCQCLMPFTGLGLQCLAGHNMIVLLTGQQAFGWAV